MTRMDTSVAVDYDPPTRELFFLAVSILESRRYRQIGWTVRHKLRPYRFCVGKGLLPKIRWRQPDA